MRKAQFIVLSAILIVSACKKAPEATHGVDTTLNDSPEAESSATTTMLDENTSDYASSGDSRDYQALSDAETEEEPSLQTATPDADTVDQSREAQSGSGPESWISTDDYPPSAIRAGEEGTTAIEWEISEQGRVENCRVTSSSGSAALDRAACAAITRRGRYSPALDQDGNAIRSKGSRRVTWTLPPS